MKTMKYFSSNKSYKRLTKKGKKNKRLDYHSNKKYQ